MAQPKKAWAPRARTGCITCRNRRVKCDEGRPVCRRCIIGGRQCSFPIDHHQLQQHQSPIAIAPKLVPRHAIGDYIKIEDADTFRSVIRSPPATPQLNGTADVADLVHLISNSHTRTSTNEDHYGRPDLPFAMSQRAALLYVFGLPRRTGHEPALDTAIKCVASILRRRRSSRDPSADGPPPGALAQYGDALRRLQDALNDTGRSRSAETLGATILLLLFEALLEDQSHASIQHALGASHLIQHRGSSAFTTTFESALLRSHMYVITVEGYFQGKHIFLEEKQWRDAILGTLTSTSTIEDKMAVTLNTVMAPCSGVMADVVKLFVDEKGYSPSAHDELLGRVDSVREGLLSWYAQWNKSIFCRVTADGTVMDRVPEHLYTTSGYQLDRLCIYEGYLMLCNRMHVALGGDESDIIEQQSQDIAKTMIGIGPNSPPPQGAPGLVPRAHGVVGSLAQTIFVLSALKGARIILDTGPDWKRTPDRNASDDLLSRQRLLPKDVVFSYMKSVGFGIRNIGMYDDQ